MPRVVSISFSGNHKLYYFGAIDGLSVGDFVVVETVRGIELGIVAKEAKDIADSEVIGELKNVIRKATDKDQRDHEANLAIKPELLVKVKEIVAGSKLDMKVLDAEYTLDKSKLIVYFSAEQRVDFRELVKDLAYNFKTRIELRQIGPRDAARLVGGIGECGRPICCSKFLGDVQNVTIKMAKNQNLALNPNTISGLCGKLLCCISFEDKQYTDTKGKLPAQGDVITTEKGDGTVTNVNLMDENVTVKYADNSVEIISLKELEEE